MLGYICRPEGQERSYADAGDGRDSDDGAVLVFLPGWEEITNLRDKLAASPIFGDEKRFRVLPLHSMVGDPPTSRFHPARSPSAFDQTAMRHVDGIDIVQKTERLRGLTLFLPRGEEFGAKSADCKRILIVSGEIFRERLNKQS